MRTLSEFKAAAIERGIDWPSARSLYDSMRADELSAHDRLVEFRREAYRRLSGDEHGGRFKVGHRKEFNGGDHTTIPGFDVVADGLRAEYPELLGAETAAAELWDTLTTPAPEPPAAADTMARALERAALECPAAPGSMRDLISIREAAALADVSEQWLRRLVSSGKLAGYRVGKSYVVSASAAARFKRHPTAGRPRHSTADMSDVPF
jgi:excisionase family DNA binding protein